MASHSIFCWLCGNLGSTSSVASSSMHNCTCIGDKASSLIRRGTTDTPKSVGWHLAPYRIGGGLTCTKLHMCETLVFTWAVFSQVSTTSSRDFTKKTTSYQPRFSGTGQREVLSKMVLHLSTSICLCLLLYLSILLPTAQGDQEKGIKPRQQNIHDKGWGGCMAGWYDVQGQGEKNDYCRWVGNCGCRGSCSWWSCALAGTKLQSTSRGKYSEPGPEIFKNDYLALKSDGSKEYEKSVKKWLPRLLEGDLLEEGQVGTAFEVTDPKEKYPLGLLKGEDIVANKISKQSFVINGTVIKKVGKRDYGSARFRPTGLYAKPGDIITVTIAPELVDKINVKLGQDHHSITFPLKKTTQKVGSPWGGLIIIHLKDIDATTKQGQFNVEIENGIQAPYFVYGEDTNEKWNKIKNNASPWTVLRIPGQLQVYIQTLHVKNETNMEKVMKGWKKTMDILDDMMGIPVGMQPGEEQLHWDPYVGGGLRFHVCTGGGKSAIGDYDYPHFLRDFCLATYHELGHGYCSSDLPGGSRVNGYYINGQMGGQWTAELIAEYIEHTKPGVAPIPKKRDINNPFTILFRMVSFKKMSKGKACGEADFTKQGRSSYQPNAYDNCWTYLYRFANWEFGWNILKKVLSLDNTLTTSYNSKTDRMADLYCKATKHNMIPLFDFYNIKVSDSIAELCQQQNKPVLISNYINIANCIMTKDINECIKLPGFPSYKGICTIDGVCNSSPDHGGKERTMKHEFDLWGGIHYFRQKSGARNTALNERNCLKRAVEIHKWCRNDMSQPVTVTFTPKDGSPKSASVPAAGNCYYDSPRLMPDYKGSTSSMVPEVCNLKCKQASYSYFGVQYTDECWCGNEAPPPSKKLNQEDCDTMCKGDNKLRCGGSRKTNIWKVCSNRNCEFKYD